MEHGAAYLASWRLSSIHSCGFPTIEFWNHQVNYLGLALLNEKLEVAKLPNENNGGAFGYYIRC